MFRKAAFAAGAQCEVLPSTATLSFANSHTSRVTEKCKVWTNTNPPITDFDIIEEGTVPMLMSPRIELTPECAYLTSESFCYIRHPLRVSTTRHLVLNLVEINKVDPTKTKVITGQDLRADYPTFSTTLNDRDTGSCSHVRRPTCTRLNEHADPETRHQGSRKQSSSRTCDETSPET